MPPFFSSSFLRNALVGALATGLSACELVEFSPNDHRARADQKDLTAKNLAHLTAAPLSPGDTLRFVFAGDSQRFYDDAQDLVRSVNQQPGIQFMLISGDISDFGLGREMRWIDNELRKMKVPYLTVIGNHDHVANGREAYQEIFGPLNYSFVYADTKFVLIDTNSREYNFNGRVPDVPWLRGQLADLNGASRSVVISHVPPQDGDFDPNLRDAYAGTLRETSSLVFEMNGHRHDYGVGQPFNDGVTYVNSYAFEKRKYLIVTVFGDKQFRIKQVSF
ncbi:metallophosphoesterase family protein [Hymenobacter lapidiphilus]|uniref:Metallophosphoesterase n=1 Tax=Hymenobacter lapidiphilus TaxID=2608003 RepID=A0A7Y7U717_9BACT|nr:metallophosphoesterase [Hymenobacter lapidiphilus]NVO33376.1 metallophosphoesterase [Hymenobacter lapidiphilus]